MNVIKKIKNNESVKEKYTLTGRSRVFAVLLSLSLSHAVFGQGDKSPCGKGYYTSPLLKTLFNKKRLLKHRINIHENEYGLSSSVLIPTGKESRPRKNEGCRYSPGKAWDKDTRTAWVEGAKGHGIGEILLLSNLDVDKKIKIWAGYGKSKKLHKANSRPKKLRVAVIETEAAGAAQGGQHYKNLKIVSERIVRLKDVNQFQSLPVNPPKNWERGGNYLLGLQILEVYKGSKYKDTCISEIQTYTDEEYCKKLWANAKNNLEFGTASACESDLVNNKFNEVYQLILKQRKKYPGFIKMLKKEQKIWTKMKDSFIHKVIYPDYESLGREAQVSNISGLKTKLTQKRTQYLEGYLISEQEEINIRMGRDAMIISPLLTLLSLKKLTFDQEAKSISN